MAFRALHELHSLFPLQSYLLPVSSSATPLQAHWPPWHSRTYHAHSLLSFCTGCSPPGNLFAQTLPGLFLHLSQDFAHLSPLHWGLSGCPIRPLLFKFVLEVPINAIWQEKRIIDVIIKKADIQFSLSLVFLGKCHYYIPNKSKKIYQETVRNKKEFSKVASDKINTKTKNLF